MEDHIRFFKIKTFWNNFIYKVVRVERKGRIYIHLADQANPGAALPLIIHSFINLVVI